MWTNCGEDLSHTKVIMYNINDFDYSPSNDDIINDNAVTHRSHFDISLTLMHKHADTPLLPLGLLLI